MEPTFFNRLPIEISQFIFSKITKSRNVYAQVSKDCYQFILTTEIEAQNRKFTEIFKWIDLEKDIILWNDEKLTNLKNLLSAQSRSITTLNDCKNIFEIFALQLSLSFPKIPERLLTRHHTLEKNPKEILSPFPASLFFTHFLKNLMIMHQGYGSIDRDTTSVLRAIRTLLRFDYALPTQFVNAIEHFSKKERLLIFKDLSNDLTKSIHLVDQIEDIELKITSLRDILSLSRKSSEKIKIGFKIVSLYTKESTIAGLKVSPYASAFPVILAAADFIFGMHKCELKDLGCENKTGFDFELQMVQIALFAVFCCTCIGAFYGTAKGIKSLTNLRIANAHDIEVIHF